MEHRVVRLVARRRDQSQGVGDTRGLLDLSSGPLGRSPVERESLLDHVVEGTDDFDHGSGCIVTVSEDDVDVGRLETSERVLESLDDVLPRESVLVGVLPAGTEEDLRVGERWTS